MSALALDADRARRGAVSKRAATVERVRLALLWLTAFSGGFVLIEPSPYEVISIAAIMVFAVTGLTMRPGHVPLMFFLILYNVGFVIALVPVLAVEKTAMWTAVSCFMAVTTMFFALALAENASDRLRVLLAAYVAAAVIVSAIGILAYFRLIPNAETFLFAGRAKSTFKDPNVFGPFLVLPALLLIQRAVAGRARDVILGGALVAVILVALLLSFSRGAWGHFAVSAALMLALMFMTSGSNRERARIVFLAALGAAAVVLFIAALLAIDQVASLFRERASLTQSYDSGHTGRFGRHLLGFLMIFDYPIGIGPLQFTKFFPENAHNSFLDAFMSGGWLGGFSFIALVALTLWVGFRECFKAAPWRAPYIAIYATFVGVVGESYIIDVNHWRHYFLIIGLLWGLAIARKALAVQDASGEALAGRNMHPRHWRIGSSER